MNMHTSITATDRTLLPRGLIARRLAPRARWKFKIGAVVQWGDDTATVRDRSLTAMGRQLFTLHIPEAAGGRAVRVVQAEYIKNVPVVRTTGIYTPLVDHVEDPPISPSQTL